MKHLLISTVTRIVTVFCIAISLFVLYGSNDCKAQSCCMMMGKGSHNHADDTYQNINTSSSDTTKTGQAAFYYTCSMHPEVKSDVPGNCPKCGMTLVKVAAGEKPKSGMGMMGMMKSPMGIVMIAMMVVMVAGGMFFFMGR